jgi:hypothetical protein
LFVALAVAGCSSGSPIASAAPTHSASARPSPTASPTATLSPTPTTVPTPAPTGFQSQPDGTLTWYTLTGDQRTVPKVDGLTAVLKAGVVEYHDSKGVKQGVFVQNFALLAADGTETQTGSVVLSGTVVGRLQAATPDMMPLPYAINEAAGMVTLGFDNKGRPDVGQGPVSRAWIDIPNGRYVRVSEFNPQNNGALVLVKGPSSSTDLAYRIDDPAYRTTSSVLGLVSILGTGDGATNFPTSRNFKTHLPLGASLLAEDYGVCGESSIQLTNQRSIDNQGRSDYDPVSSDLFLKTADGTYIAIMPNP